MLIFGWGTDTAVKQVNEWTVAICRYRYFSFFFVFSIVVNRQWFLQGRDRAEDTKVTAEQLEAMYGEDAVPKPTFWRSWSLLAVPGSFVALSVVVALISGVAGLFGFEGDNVAADVNPIAEVAPGDDMTEEDPAGASVSEEQGGSSESQSDAGSAEAAGEGTTDIVEEAGASVDADSAPTDVEQLVTTDSVRVEGSIVSEVAGVVELTSDGDLMSTNMLDLTGPYGQFSVDSVFAVASHLVENRRPGLDRPYTIDLEAGPGNKLVIADIQLYVRTPFTNLRDGMFRLVDRETGRLYPSLAKLNMGASSGTILNEQLAFEVPAGLTSFVIQGGAQDGEIDGYRAEWNVELAPGGPEIDTAAAVVEGPITSSLVSESSEGSSVLYDQGLSWSVDLDVLAGEVVSKLGPASARPGHKWVVVEAQAVGLATPGVFQEASVHLVVDGERYPHVGETINTGLSAGDIWSGLFVFEIPAAADRAVLTLGRAPDWDGGERAEYELVLP